MSEKCPCKGCTERFIACSGRCPKDARGEYGYETWKAELDAMKNASKLQKSIALTASKRRSKWAYAKEYRR